MKLKKKHYKLANHYLRFAHATGDLTTAQVAAFILYESTGVLTGEVDIQVLIKGKQNKELTIKMIYEEVFYYWSQGWTWALPLLDIISDEEEDEIFKSNCQTIFDTLKKRGVQNVLENHSQFSAEQKERWISCRVKTGLRR